MSNTLGMRIEIIRNENRYDVIPFGKLFGVSKATYHNYVSGKSSPTADFLVKMLELFPQYTAEWLLLGNNEVKKDNRSNVMAMEPGVKYGNEITKQQLKQLFNKIAEEIDEL